MLLADVRNESGLIDTGTGCQIWDAETQLLEKRPGKLVDAGRIEERRDLETIALKKYPIVIRYVRNPSIETTWEGSSRAFAADDVTTRTSPQQGRSINIISELRVFILAMYLAVVGIGAGTGLIETIAEYDIEIVVTVRLNSIVAIIGGTGPYRGHLGDRLGPRRQHYRQAQRHEWARSGHRRDWCRRDRRGYENPHSFTLLAMMVYPKVLVIVVPL